MVFGNVKNASGSYEKKYLYDMDQQKNAVHYYFKTIGNVGISNLKVKYAASSYSRRYFYLTYNLAETIGYSYIKYNVYKVIDGTEEVLMTKVVSENDTLFKNSMHAYLYIPNTSGVVTSNTYRIEVQPVLTSVVNGEETDVLLETESYYYTFNTLYKPYFNISKSFVVDSLSLRVNVKDYHKSIVNGKYRIQILDASGNDITPSAYQDTQYSISTVNQTFSLSGISSNSRYQLVIYYDEDIYNNVTKIIGARYVYNITVNQSGEIGLGNIYADTDMSDSTKVNLRFFDSYQLTKAKKIRYSIFNEAGYSVDNEAIFVPSLITSSDATYYEYQLPTSINTPGIYYISMQFLNEEGSIIAEDTIEYRLL